MTDIVKPDYARLKNSLLTSGIQQSNNSLYQIIDQLIKVGEQSFQPAEPFDGVITDPAGALNGNGLSNNPLKVRVDGISISIDSSNNLKWVPAGVVQFATVILTASQLDTIFATPVSIVSGVAGYLIVPLAWSAVIDKTTGAWSISGALQLQYTTTTTAIVGTVNMSALTGAGAGQFGQIAEAQSVSWAIGGVSRIGLGVSISASGDFGPPANNLTTCKISFAYYFALT